MSIINSVANQSLTTGSSPTFVSPTFTSPVLGTPASGNLVNCTGYPAAGITGQIPLANGGTSANLTASNGGIFYSTASAGAILAGNATANLPLLSGSSSAPVWGGFALNLGGALNSAGALTLSGAFGATFIFTNTTSVTFPTSGTLATTSQIPSVTPSALTQANDTNVTLTLGGTPATALLQATSITAGWTGTLAGTRGGLGAAITASNGGIYYSTATNGALLSGTATAGQLLISGSNAAPAWTTSTYPSTNSVNTLLYASGANVMAELATANDGVLVTSNSGVPSWLANSGTAGFVLTANAGAPPSWQVAAATGAVTTIDADAGSASPAAGVITMTGGTTGLTTSAAGSTVTLTGTLVLANGGTNASLTASNGGIFYSTASAGAILAGTATARQMLQSGSSTTPAWSTCTWPATTTINQLLYSSSANTVVGLATVTAAVLTTVVGVPTWAAQLSLTLGGTNAALTASNGGIFYSTASAGAILAGTATAGQLLTSGSSAAPAWTTSTYPATNAVNTLLYASSANTMAALATANDGVLITSNTGVPSWLANSGTAGFVLTANTGAPPSWQTISAGGAITTVNGDAGSITPTAGVITISGGTSGLTTSGTASTLSLTGTLAVLHGGTGITSFGTGVATALGQNVSGTGGMVLTTSPTITTPRISQINDANGNEILSLPATATAVNYMVINNSATGNATSITNDGANANIQLNIVSKGTGALTQGNFGTLNQFVWFTGAAFQHTTNWNMPSSSASRTITVPDASGTLTLQGTIIVVTWAGIAGTTQAAAVNTGYVVQNAAQTTITLPATAAIGSVVSIRGLGAAGWILAANTGQTIKMGSQTTSSAGSLTSAEQYDTVDVTCIVADTTWVVNAVISSGLTVA